MARREEDEEEQKPKVIEDLDHRTSAGSRTSSALSRRDRASTRTSRTSSITHRRDTSTIGAETTPPNIIQPQRRFESGFICRWHLEAGKQELARRLSLLAQRLTYGDSMEELVALDSQVNQIEQALGGGMGGSGISSVLGSPRAMGSPLSKRDQRRPMSVQTPMRNSIRSDFDGGALFSSPESSFYRSQYSDMSPSLSRHHHEESEEEEQPPPKKGMSAQQANKVIAEMLKLNDELSTVVNNLQARQEESDHIHKLLIERAERAAQRIIFLQNRITYLEQELQENDQELQHLRICLKAVEIQMPPHPDRELQRCFSVFKEGYQALKRKRAHRSSMVSFLGYDQAIAASSPSRLT
ncbi:hypothetical protein PT974_10806 [Cladobotryum mycophilum]|uniref:Uncharacterized protein n=1 Tax=Cladobotryum mycophilum TaxID=491253 RepID=A0ABR0SB25_9HYPO